MGKIINKLLGIRFDNEHGGKYAYMQFLAYSRELMALLDELPNTQRYINAIEAIAWQFNENLTGRFSHTQRAVFETKMMDFRAIVNEVEFTLNSRRHLTRSSVLHAQAA
jgi:hypothetical protein